MTREEFERTKAAYRQAATRLDARDGLLQQLRQQQDEAQAEALAAEAQRDRAIKMAEEARSRAATASFLVDEVAERQALDRRFLDDARAVLRAAHWSWKDAEDRRADERGE